MSGAQLRWQETESCNACGVGAFFLTERGIGRKGTWQEGGF